MLSTLCEFVLLDIYFYLLPVYVMIMLEHHNAFDDPSSVLFEFLLVSNICKKTSLLQDWLPPVMLVDKSSSASLLLS